MNVDQLVPRPKKRVEFSLRYRHSVPSEPGCYVLATAAANVIYVGLATNLRRRFSQHRDTKEKRQRTPVGVAFWFYFMTCAESDTCRIERTWLNEHLELHAELPILNKVYSPVR